MITTTNTYSFNQTHIIQVDIIHVIIVQVPDPLYIIDFRQSRVTRVSSHLPLNINYSSNMCY